MEIRYAAHPQDVKTYDTARLRRDFLIEELFVPDEVKLVYSHVDRIIAGGVMPLNSQSLVASKELGVEYFLERRELGIINIGGNGQVTVDGKVYELQSRDALYVGMGAREVSFTSDDAKQPAKFYLNSTPAHKTYPTVKIDETKANKVRMGAAETANLRTINQYIHPAVLQTCQLLMGMTRLESGSVWNTMPAHTHDRRMEVYLYFDLPADAMVIHLMGEPTETRSLVVRNEQAVISPSWSIHSGCGSASYTFIWGMAGENQTFTDMDHIPMTDLK